MCQVHHTVSYKLSNCSDVVVYLLYYKSYENINTGQYYLNCIIESYVHVGIVMKITITKEFSIEALGLKVNLYWYNMTSCSTGAVVVVSVW
jgi:hypothetical protein